MVVDGKSLQTTYDFDTEGVIQEGHLEIGRRRVLKNVLLQAGEIVKIQPEKKFIHSVIHLTKPTLTFIIRTTRNETQMKQYTYYSLYRNRGGSFVQHIEKKIQLMQLLISSKSAFDPKMFFSDTNAEDFSKLLHTYYSITKSKEKVMDIIDMFKDKHGSWLMTVMQSMHLDEWSERISYRKIYTEHEMLLAGLLTKSHSFAEIQSLMHQLNPSYATPENIFQLLRKICTEEISKMNVPEIGFDMLPVMIEKKHKDDETFLHQLSSNGWNAVIEEQKDDVLRLKQQIQNNQLFKSLLN